MYRQHYRGTLTKNTNNMKDSGAPRTSASGERQPVSPSTSELAALLARYLFQDLLCI
ncbi:hypothetical protein JG687_00013439 [Phytophthora cactorum]|uniref:Uncharacterized protein n=1 Tax=Phytophthora cactorum TaxID=29920 RepID=A0A8T1TZC9_9STRA|nr:hypothetical protein GQ600_20164 [Phytophthora cactorum]KAG6951738.1 hypothetical protein JG687_00013439 [Phytophthora cactorum]